jgi:DNA helicase-2/ATP-dependent DNA helicase PcrA
LDYLKSYNPVQLRWNNKKKCNIDYPILNFGESKGLAFDRVIIYPTEDMEQWINNRSIELAEETRAKFYVAITRAKKSVAIVVDDKMIEESKNNDFSFYIPMSTNNLGDK